MIFESLLFGRHRREHFTRAVGLQRTDEPCAFHGFDHARRAVVANLKSTLYAGNRGLAAFEHDADGLIVEWILLAIRTFSTLAFAAFARQSGNGCARSFENFLDVRRWPRTLERADNSMHFSIRDE